MTEDTAWRADGEFMILFGLYQEHWKTRNCVSTRENIEEHWKTSNCVSTRENSARENNWRNAC